MREKLRIWKALFSIWLQDGLAYRASAVIWILSDTIPAMIMPAVFIAGMSQGGQIGGFDAGQFVAYYLVMLLFANFITSHLMWDMAYEIKEGIFTIHLLRPVSYFQSTTIRNLAWRVMRTFLFVPIFGLLLIFYGKYLTNAHVYLGWEVWIAVILGHIVSWCFVYMMTMLALFFTEVQSIFALYYFPMLFLSGQLFPIHLLPDWAGRIAMYLPFYYTTGLPVELVVHRIAPEAALPLLGVQLIWIVASVFGAKVLWKYGLRQYTAVGM